jgi:glycosyltransferase involved in cell wall biosynthesis
VHTLASAPFLMPTPVVSVLYKRWANHAAWSGYPRFVEYLGGRVRVRRVPPTLRPQRMLKAIDRHLGYTTDHEHLGLDLSAARRLAIGRGEVVHLLYHEWDHFYAGRLRQLGHLRGNRLMATFHLPPSELERRPPGSFEFERIDLAVALGNQLASYLRGKVGAARVVRASLGVDIRAWHPAPARQSSAPTCVFVGFWLRDFSMLEEVIRLVVTVKPAARFEVVTSSPHVGSLSALPNVRARVGISDSELRNTYQRAWVHVLPLIDCVANNSLLEGMATGLPTVTTAVGDVLDYATDRSAICVAPGDASGMAAAVLDLLDDSQRRQRLGRAARDIAETLNLEAVAQRHVNIYRELASRGRSHSARRSRPERGPGRL